MLRRLLLLACGLNCFAIAPALAQDTPLWRTVGQWQIRVDASLGYGCFLVGSYTRGTVLRIGIDQQNGNGYVMVGNEAWRSLQVGNQYDLALRFDNNFAVARTRDGAADRLRRHGVPLSVVRPRALPGRAGAAAQHEIYYQGDVVTAASAAWNERRRAGDDQLPARRRHRPQATGRRAIRSPARRRPGLRPERSSRPGGRAVPTVDALGPPSGLAVRRVPSAGPSFGPGGPSGAPGRPGPSPARRSVGAHPGGGPGRFVPTRRPASTAISLQRLVPALIVERAGDRRQRVAERARVRRQARARRWSAGPSRPRPP